MQLKHLATYVRAAPTFMLLRLANFDIITRCQQLKTTDINQQPFHAAAIVCAITKYIAAPLILD